jgi:hypothetical protein
MDLFILKIGKSKKKMEDIIIDKMSSVDVYLNSRNADRKTGKCSGGWFNVSPAPKEAVAWRKKSTTVGGNKCHTVPRIGKNGQTKFPGYISKHGFQPHT